MGINTQSSKWEQQFSLFSASRTASYQHWNERSVGWSSGFLTHNKDFYLQARQVPAALPDTRSAPERCAEDLSVNVSIECGVSIEKSNIDTDRSSSTVSFIYCFSCYCQVLSKHQDDHRHGIRQWKRQNMSPGKQTCLIFVLSKASSPPIAM